MVEKITTSPKDPREKARQRVEHQIKMELEALQNSTKKEYDEGKLLELLKDYLHILKEKSREELTEKNTAAWIIAVQFALLTIDLYSDESPLSRNDEIVFYLYLFSTLDGIL